MQTQIISALVDVRSAISELDRAIASFLAIGSEQTFPPVNVLAQGPIDLGDELPPQCASGLCNDD